MIKHICRCGYIYNPEYGDIDGDIDPGVSFVDLPDDWLCPICGLPKSAFTEKEKKAHSHYDSLN